MSNSVRAEDGARDFKKSLLIAEGWTMGLTFMGVVRMKLS